MIRVEVWFSQVVQPLNLLISGCTINEGANMTMMLRKDYCVHCWRRVLLRLWITDTMDPWWGIQWAHTLQVCIPSCSLSIHTKEWIFCQRWLSLLLIGRLANHIIVAKGCRLLFRCIPVWLPIFDMCLILVMIPNSTINEAIQLLSLWLLILSLR